MLRPTASVCSLDMRLTPAVTSQTDWGRPSLTVATQLLLRAALEDAENERFVLLDETAVPLYPAPATYLLLIGETRSRMRGCEVRRLRIQPSLRHYPPRTRCCRSFVGRPASAFALLGCSEQGLQPSCC